MTINNYCEMTFGGEFHMAMRPIADHFEINLYREIEWLKEHGIEVKQMEYLSHGQLVKDFCIPMKWAIAWVPNIARHDHVIAKEVLEVHEHIFVNMKFFGLC